MIKLMMLGLFLSQPVFAGSDPETLEFPWANFDDWYYKQTDVYKGWHFIVLHHSATNAGSVSAFHEFHTKQGYGGVAYHFVIGNGNGMKDGEVQETFRWKEQISGTHVKVDSWRYNVFGIGICLVGNLEKNAPTKAQMAALKKLVARLKKTYKIKNSNIIGHSHVKHDDDPTKTAQTACPGKKLDIKQVKRDSEQNALLHSLLSDSDQTH